MAKDKVKQEEWQIVSAASARVERERTAKLKEARIARDALLPPPEKKKPRKKKEKEKAVSV